MPKRGKGDCMSLVKFLSYRFHHHQGPTRSLAFYTAFFGARAKLRERLYNATIVSITPCLK